MIHDAAIVGGGPAGAALAIRLARQGLAVVVVDRGAAARPALGETLPPEASADLADLRLWEAFLAAGHLPSPGIVRAWETAEPRETDHLFNPFGCGWRLDRAAFDALLLAAAEEAGAEVLRDARAGACRRVGGGWEIGLRVAPSAQAASNGHDAGPRTLRARFLVDATGRSATIARRLGAIRRRHDALVAVAGLISARRDDARLVLEACEAGWWHSGPLPRGAAFASEVVAVLMTDADLLPRSPSALRDFWLESLRSAPLTGASAWDAATDPGPDGPASPIDLTGPLRCVPAESALTLPACGPDWLAVGDAAAAWDPLSGRGIPQALATAGRAAEAISSAFDGRRAALDDYASRLAEDFAAHLALRRRYYARVGRFRPTPFWRRRESGA